MERDDRSQRIRAVPSPRYEEPFHDVGKLGWFAKMMHLLPPWGRVLVATVLAGTLGGGIGIAGFARWAGIEMTSDAVARETRIIDRVKAVEERLTVTEQNRRKEGLSKQAKADLAKLLEISLSAQSIGRVKKRAKAAPAHAPAAVESAEDERP
jgi:hypothetical protein